MKLPRIFTGCLYSLATWLLAAASLAGCGGGGSAAGSTDTWVVLGSSTAAGTGASPGQAWADRLRAEAVAARAGIDNRARPGTVTWQAMPAGTARPADRPATIASMDIDAVLATRPTLLMLASPTNDTLQGYAADETIANLVALRRRALDAGTAVVVLSTQPRNDASAARRATLRTIDTAMAAEVGACFVAVRAALEGESGGLSATFDSGDGVHPNDAGHALIHERLRAVVTAHLADGRCGGR